MIGCCRSIRAEEYILKLILVFVCALEYITFHHTAECIFFQKLIRMGNFFAVACGKFYFATVLERNFLYIIDKSTVKCIWICFVTVGRRTHGSLQRLYGFCCSTPSDNGCCVIVPILIVFYIK